MCEPTKSTLQQKSWQSWELLALAANGTEDPITAVTPFDAAQAIVFEDFESFPVLHVERSCLTTIEQDGPDYYRVDPILGFTRYRLRPQGRM